MNYLVFDCVLNKTFITLVCGDKKIAKTIESDENNYHSLFLPQEIKNILENNNLKFENLDFIGTDIGPASFTGIRVGLCIAKVIASESHLPLVPVRSVDVLTKASGTEHAFLDARRGSYIYYNSIKDEIFLIPKTEALEVAKDIDSSIICDTNCYKYLAENDIKSINYEDENFDIGGFLADIALDKYNTLPKNLFEVNNIKPLYIQTPPIFSKN